ncbi:MAG: GxxExxY protein [Planctomycetia bacterium]|nr:GxxExxY protein [Planctomycetia bacterium]
MNDESNDPRTEDPVTVFYKEVELHTKYKPDFICFGEVVVELKALTSFSGTEESQVLNYLKVTRFKVGLLLNFGNPSLEFERYVWSDRWGSSLDVK